MIAGQRYCGCCTLEGADSLAEARDKLLAEVEHLKSLEKKGWEFIAPVKQSHAILLLDLKPYTLGDSTNPDPSKHKRRKA